MACTFPIQTNRTILLSLSLLAATLTLVLTFLTLLRLNYLPFSGDNAVVSRMLFVACGATGAVLGSCGFVGVAMWADRPKTAAGRWARMERRRGEMGGKRGEVMVLQLEVVEESEEEV